ncbi:MAG: FliA/WhiG family RNA polymerase sigma factor [Bacillota bacterium]|nr:FliA/WhiG family RNA polymerase sigma factor [Bacillota bacterium]MDD3297314.1 FliA/WhiG family RNA polymerase sigma factor [Bacillota bacterium]MDD3850107.1 FliA/WhiG family RNA polymerase sigma factor [Bacillota bacterium]MDD4706830.1 FliA/WhiG family RNA polymerase sigma factor [Bacillota bacterium]
MDIKKLWVEYKKNGHREVRNILINHYIPLVRITAGRLKSTIRAGSVEMDDLVSYGVLGLMDALEKFDLEKKVKFETYAQMRIRGAMIDQLRKIDWAPRSLRQKARQIEGAYSDLETKLGRAPTDSEVAEFIGVEKEIFLKTLGDISTLSVLSLEELFENRMETRASALNEESGDSHCSRPEEQFEVKEVKRLLKESIENLPERERLLITLYYYEGLTYKEIGEVLDISESRVSQLHTRAVLRMRNRLSVHRADLTI